MDLNGHKDAPPGREEFAGLPGIWSILRRVAPYLGAGIVLIIAIWGAAFWAVWNERAFRIDNEARRARELVAYFEEHTRAIFRYSDTFIQSLRREYIDHGSLAKMREMLKEVPPDQTIISHVTLIDETGRPLLVSGHKIKPGTSARDRGYFQAQKSNPGDNLYISLPLRGRNSGKRLLRAVRKIIRPNGEFGGVIFAAIEIEPITKFFRTFNLGPQSSATLVGSDKRIRARSSYGRLGPGQDISGSRIWRELEKSPVGLYRQVSIVDGVDRFYAYRKIPEFPLIVAIGVSLSDIAQGITQFGLYVFLVAGLVSGVIAVLTALVSREVLTRRALEEGILERKAMETALRESEGKFRATFDNSPSAIFLKDLEGRFQMVNRKYREWYQFTPDEMMGKTTHDLFPAELADKFIEQEKEVLEKNEAVEREFQFPRPDGSIQHAINTKFPVSDGEGNLVGVGTITTDVTEHRRAEELLRQAQKMEAVGQLAGGIAHDFNNILQVIINYSKMALSGLPGTEKLPRYMGEVIQAGERAAHLTEQLLAFSRKKVIQPENLNLNDLTNNLLNMVGRLIGEHIQLEFKPDPRLHRINADPGMMEQIILNLCVNARDAMPAGGQLTLETGNFLASPEFCSLHDWKEPGKYVELSLSDNGEGMTPEIQQHVFEPFFTTKEVGQGSGLGLAMVYGYVEQHQGKILLSSEPGAGSTFTIYFPVAEVSEEAAIATEAKEVSGGQETILVAEDEEGVRELLTELLESKGYRVLASEDGEEALGIFKEQYERIDLVILDVVMPRMGGRVAYDQIRQIKENIAVIFTSGYATNSMDSKFLSDSGKRLIQKPYPPDILFHTVREVLDNR